MLDKLNPYIRFARIMTFDRDALEISIAYDHRLFVCLDGVMNVECDDCEYRLSTGEAIFIPQYTPYRLYKLDCRMISFNFDLTADHSEYSASLKTHPFSKWDGNRLYTETALPHFDRVQKLPSGNVKSMLTKAVEAFSNDEDFGRELASAYLKCALIGMLAEPMQAKHPAVLEFLRIVRERYSGDITAADIAREIGYHEGYLNRLVKAQLGMCVSEYIIGYRIDEAKKLLDLGHSVTEAATACGFSELSYFSHCFKRIVGVTPREYKRSCELL